MAVVVVKSAQQPARPDPVLYISGGPGSPLTIYTDYQARHPYAPGRDLILVDQRGMGRSEPSLCPELNGKLVEAGVAVATDASPVARASRRAMFMDCRERAVAQGVDLNDFGTSVTVEDFEQVRQALGIARWNIFGESYGTTVAMTLMARHPDTIRSAVLDSVYPPDPILPLWSTEVAEARSAFFASCSRDRACASAFPHLSGMYLATLSRLRQRPVPVPIPPEMHYPGDHMLLTASLFELVVGHIIYYPSNYPGLPRMIAAAKDGDMTVFGATLASLLASARDVGNEGAYAAVECRDRPRFRQPLVGGADVMDRTLLYDICDGWSELGPSPVVPRDTDVPTLVLAGQFDPNAGPAASRHVADLIGSHARWIEFPLIGHNVRHFSSCGARIVADFIDRPAQAPSISCADRVAPIRFLPRR